MGIMANSTVSGTPPAGDQASSVVTGSFTSSTTSPFFDMYGYFNISVWGTFSATIVVNRSFDGGTTWIPVSYPLIATAVSLTAPASITLFEVEKAVLYQLACTYTSGTANYRMSGSAGYPTRGF